jgi:hypothetical protein
MACVEYVDFRARCVLVIAFRFAKIEGEIVLALVRGDPHLVSNDSHHE